VKIGQLTSEGINEAHNGYLEIYLNLGWAGIALLGLIIATGFPKVLRALRLDTESGKLMLAYFILGLIYNFTEAGFKMMNPVWIFFIMAVMAVPGEVLSEGPAKLELPPFKTRTRQGVVQSSVSKHPISRLRTKARGRQKVTT